MQVVEVSRSRTNNLDALRLIFAVVVIFSHSFPLTGGLRGYEQGEPLYAWSQGRMTLGTLSVAFFFILSGYLITASWLRSRGLGDFLFRRSRRILPGYVSACLICIAVLPFAGPVTGDAVTTVAASFARFEVARHAMVFPSNPLPNELNGSMWTIPYECWCYAGLAGAGLLGLLRRRPAVLSLFLLALAFVVARGRWPELFQQRMPLLGGLFDWPVLATYFFAGAALFVWHEWVPRSAWLALVCAIVVVVSLGTGRVAPITTAVAVAGGYVVLWVGFHPGIRLAWTSRWGDLSYGTYLYAFPIQQLLARYVTSIGPLAMFALATPLTLVMAFLSWHLVEKRFLHRSRVRANEAVGVLVATRVSTPADLPLQAGAALP